MRVKGGKAGRVFAGREARVKQRHDHLDISGHARRIGGQLALWLRRGRQLRHDGMYEVGSGAWGKFENPQYASNLFLKDES